MRKLLFILVLVVVGTASAQLVINGSRSFPLPNSGTGTTQNSLAVINTSGQAVTATTGNTGVPAFIVLGGAGTSGTASLATSGLAACTMDASLGSAGGAYVIASVTNAGQCHPQTAAPGTGVWVVGAIAGGSTTASATATVQVQGYVYGGSGMIWPGTPGITVCTGTPCTAWGTSLTAPSGAIVGITDSQTLTNKSIAGTEINSSTVGATYGGTGLDTHTLTGLAQLASGTWSVSNTLVNPLTFSGTTSIFNSPEVSAPTTPGSGVQVCFASAGNGLECKDHAGTVYKMTTPGSGTNYQTVQNTGSALPPEPSLNMIITGGACVDNAGSTRTDCTIPSGGTVTTVSTGNLSPLFTASIANATTTPALSFALTNAGGGTVFGRSAGSTGAPAYTITPVLGIPTASQGTLGFAGATSGTATVTALAAAGTPTITLPNASGTVAVTASAPIVLSATTGNLTGPTIVTATALTNQRIPKATGTQSLVDGCLTDNGTQVANTCTGGFVAGPASAANMIMSGVSTNTDAVGKVTLSSGSGTYSFIGTYTTAPMCMFRDITTPANAVTTQTVSTTTITLAGTGTDVIGYICLGFN